MATREDIFVNPMAMAQAALNHPQPEEFLASMAGPNTVVALMLLRALIAERDKAAERIQ